MASIISVLPFVGERGKSNMTANLAAVIAGEEQRVAVIDTDIRSPGLHVLFGLSGTGAHDDEAAVRVTRGRDLRQPRDQSG